MAILLAVPAQPADAPMFGGILPFGLEDGSWYISIATNGYHAFPLDTTHGFPFYDFSFFPLWPAILAIPLRLGLPVAAAGSLINNAVFIAAGLLLFRAFEPRFGRRAALAGLAFLAFFPASYVFSLDYAEALLLLICALYFNVGPRSRWAPILAGAAAATRMTGLAVSVAACAGPLAERRRPTGMEALTIAAGPAVFLAWWLFIAQLTGRADGFLLGSPAWATAAKGGLITIATSNLGAFDMRKWIPVAAFLLPLVGVRPLLERRRLDLLLFMAAVVLPAAWNGTWFSLPRYVLVAVPIFFGIAALLPRRTTAILVGALSAAGLVLFTVLVLRGGLIP